MRNAFRLSAVFPVVPARLYEAWMSSTEHAAFTGAAATIQPEVGGNFSAWEGYIEGTTIELEPGRRVVQTWRTSEFDDDMPDSRLEVLF